MPENKQISTVFQFATVRSPKKPASTGTPVVLIDYTSTVSATAMFNRLAAIAADTKATPMQKLTAMRAEANSFKTTSAFAATLAQLNDAAPGVSYMGEWLSEHASTLTAAMVTEYLEDNSVEAMNAGTRARLWDNLFTHLIVGGDFSMRQHLIETLRADHFLRNYRTAAKDIVPDSVLRQLASSQPLLPSAVFPLPQIQEEQPDPGPGDPPYDPTADLDRLNEVKSTIAELQDVYNRQLESGFAQQTMRDLDNGTIEVPGKVLGTDVGLITDKLRSSLSNSAKAVLDTYKIGVGSRVAFAVDKLSAAEMTISSKLWGDVSLTRRLYNVAGALWVLEADLQEHELGPAGPAHHGDVLDKDCPKPQLGIADLRRVEQELCCYKPGEVAHIENILQGEYKERSTRRLKRTEETFTFSSEREQVDERDTQTTDRFDLQRESSNTITKETSLEAGIKVTATWGPVKVEAGLGFSTSSSSTQSDKEALTYAHSVTDKALQRITEKVREERITKVLDEFEENNKHGLDNRGGTAHVVGLYRWADKLYKVQVVNYGKRLMLDFTVPEPGAYHLWAMTKPAATSSVAIEEPLDPRAASTTNLFGQAVTPLRKHTDVTTGNYALWASAYGATVEAPPQPIRVFTKALGRENAKAFDNVIQPQDEIRIDEGYEAKTAWVELSYNGGNPSGAWGKVIVGRHTWGWSNPVYLNNETSSVPVSLIGWSSHLALHVEVEAHLSSVGFETWQIKTFKAIMDAYERQKLAYQNALAEAKVQRGVDIQGTNPLLNRTIEQNELKKACINWMYNGANFTTDGIIFGNDDCHPPINKTDCATWEGGSRARFMEQAFEWNLMTYLFYPYYWATKCRWRKLYQLNDIDPLFQLFLQSGMARVTVPVRPGFENAVMYFLSTGQIWNGGDAPVINDPLYISIADELAQPVGAVEGDPWEVRVPTSLTVLQCASGCVEGDGLPCDCGDAFGVGTGGDLTGGDDAPDEEHP